MPMCEIKDHKTGQTLKAYDFGGPEIYYAGADLVYAPIGGTSVSRFENTVTLSPLGITSIMKPRWEVTGHVGICTINWRVSVVDTSTGETKDGVYPFNLQGNVYELECQPGTWVIASCGGYKIESSWSGQQSNEAYRLKGTGEIIKLIAPNIVVSDMGHGGSIGSTITNTSPYYLQGQTEGTQHFVVYDKYTRTIKVIPYKAIIFGSRSDYVSVWNPVTGQQEEIYAPNSAYAEVVEYPTEVIEFFKNQVVYSEYLLTKTNAKLFEIPTATSEVIFTPATWHIGEAWWDTYDNPAYFKVVSGKEVRLYNWMDYPYIDEAFIRALAGLENK